MTGLYATGAVLLLGGITLWLLSRTSRQAGRKDAENDAYEEAWGDVVAAQKARDRLADLDERRRMRERYTKKQRLPDN